MRIATLFLCFILTACGSTPPVQITKTELVKVNVPVETALPEELLRECLIPVFPERATVGAAQDLIAVLYTSLWLCEEQRQGIQDRQPSP